MTTSPEGKEGEQLMTILDTRPTQTRRRKDDNGRSAGPSVESGRQAKGLCMTCAHASSCAARLRTREAVTFCEEFRVSEAESTKPVPRSISPVTPPGIVQGLCATCRHQESCRLRRGTDPVWQCEEFS